MIVTRSSIIPYRKSLPRPITTAHTTYSEREGFLLILSDEAGHLGIGDCAPLPGFSKESPGTAQKVLSELAATLLQRGMNTIAGIPGIYEGITRDPEIERIRRLAPSVLFAASTALWDLALQDRGLPLSLAVNRFAAKSIAVNGLLDDGEPDEMRAQALKIVARGPSSIKMKLGVGSAERDIARVVAVTKISPEITLRLDINGAWTASVLREALPRLPIHRIEFIEQPLPVGQALIARDVCTRFGCNLALDEEIVDIDAARQLIVKRSCDVVVLKPMTVGGIHSCLQLGLEAGEAGIAVIYTSSWESDIGIAATLHLAAALGPNPPAMGLSTAGMISDGIVKTPLKIENGFLKVPEGPGLGIELAPELLAQLNRS